MKKRTPNRPTGTLRPIDLARVTGGSHEWSEALITETTIPAMDGSGKEPG